MGGRLNLLHMEKLTFTPVEFAALFGKERTWAYRQLKAGKVQAITELGRTLIPRSEVERVLNEAGRYLGKNAEVKPLAQPAPPEPKSGSGGWAAAVKLRMKQAARKKAGRTE